MDSRQFLLCACRCGMKALWILFAVTALAGLSFAQSIPGTLTDTVTTTHSTGCDSETNTITTYVWTFTDPSGGKHSFPGDSESEVIFTEGVDHGRSTCGPITTITSLDEWSSDGLYYLEATGASGSVTAVGGYVNPKYKIIGVMYSPPGSKSTVTYADNSVVGSSTSVMSTISSADMQSISISSGISIFGFTDKVTTTASDTYTQEESSSSTIAVSQTTSSSTGLSGYSDPATGLNHDYDYIFVWLNPIARFAIYPTKSPTLVEWMGYGYDLNDTPAYPDMDVIGVQLGCLNGDFYSQYESGTSTNWTTCEDVFNNNFSRGWALTNTDGSSPALTPTLANSSAPYDFCAQKGTDLYNICLADPFSNPSYAVTFPSGGGDTTTDGRFTACSNTLCSATIEYEPSVSKTYSQGYSTTLTANETDKYTYSESFSIETQLGYSASGCKNYCLTFSDSLTTKNTYTWSDQFSYSTNSSNGQTASFSIEGPAEGYGGPLSFTVYQDNLYGTFMFYPVTD
jgi:hypothetical protein